MLSPFTVNAETDTGYAASSTLAGSRFKTDLKDTAASISVFTTDFLNDIGATNLSDAMAYSTSAQADLSDRSADSAVPNGNAVIYGPSEFRVRGQPTSRTRDYFTLRIEADTYNSERIEDARGPNSVLFGFGAPGGIINVNIKQARLDKSSGQATFSVGSFDSYRQTIDYNHVFSKEKAALRVNLLNDKSNSFQEYGFNKDQRAHLAVKAQVTQSTVFRAEYERALIEKNKPRLFGILDGGVQLWRALGSNTYPTTTATNAALGITRLGSARRLVYVGNNNSLIEAGQTLVTTDQNVSILDRSLTDPSINYGGPGQLRETAATTYSAYIEQRFGANTFLELAYNHQSDYTDNINPGQTNMKLWGDPSQTLRNSTTSVTDDRANPYAGQAFMENSSSAWERYTTWQKADTFRATLSTQYNAEKWGHYQLAIMADHDKRSRDNIGYNEIWADRPFNATPENSANHVRRRNYVTLGDWSTYYINSPLTTGLLTGVTDPITGQTLRSAWIPRSAPQDTDETQKSWLVTGQARYFDNRLVLGAGVRKDDLSILNLGATRDPVTNMWITDYVNIPASEEREASTYTFGAVYHATKTFSVHYNQANNQGLPRAVRIIDINNLSGPTIAPPNSEGQGKDIGITVHLLDNRLTARASYYTTNSVDLTASYGTTGVAPENVAPVILDTLLNAGRITAAERDRHLTDQNSVKFDMDSEGYELNLTANLTRNWRLQANYSYTDTKQTNFGPEIKAWMDREIAYWRSFNAGSLVTAGTNTIDGAIATMLEGYTAQTNLEQIGELGTRQHKANFFTRYDFSGDHLRGAYVGGGYRYQSKNLAGADLATVEGYYGEPIVWQADFLAGYKFSRSTVKKWSRFLAGLSLQLNVSNVFNDDDFLITRIENGGIIRRTVVQSPRTWRVQAKLDF